VRPASTKDYCVGRLAFTIRGITNHSERVYRRRRMRFCTGRVDGPEGNVAPSSPQRLRQVRRIQLRTHSGFFPSAVGAKRAFPSRAKARANPSPWVKSCDRASGNQQRTYVSPAASRGFSRKLNSPPAPRPEQPAAAIHGPAARCLTGAGHVTAPADPAAAPTGICGSR